jgi:hypothetical protein
MIFAVKREGNQLQAQLTGQSFVEMFPESESKFFYKVVDAQLEFKGDSGGVAETVTLYQHGQVVTMPRIDNAVAEQMRANLAAKMASQTATPGGEAAVRLLSEGLATGKPDYSKMGPELADVLKKQLPSMQPQIASLGALKSVTFRNVTGQGADLYLATYEKGSMAWRVVLGPDGKVVGAMVTPDF